jgi:MYXO-CTERM domain-containing protein
MFVLTAGCSSSSSEEGDLNDCGNINVEASAECTVEVEGGCTAACTPLSFRGECNGRCGGTFSADCTASCEADCSASCEVDPGSLSCEGACELDCNAGCEGHCEADPNSASCQASCEASCEGECGVSCEGTPPSASCEAKCQAGCEGSCTIEADFDCNIECQAELSGGCEIACESPEGALYCDGQYVDHGGNMASCISALNAYLDVEVDASASAACEGGKCTAEAEASCQASIGPRPSSQTVPWFAAGLAALGLAVAARRRRRD